MDIEANKQILFYESTFYMFSNFSAHAVEINGKRYPTSEHAYQAMKFEDENIHEEIRNTTSPAKAKAIAHAHPDKKISNWNDQKVDVMEEIIREKALQHDEVMDTLLKTENKFIGENSPVDYFWGVGADGSGENWIGKIWMKLREEFRSSNQNL